MEEKKNGEGKHLERENIFFCGGDGKGGKILVENIQSAEEKKS